MNYKEKFLTRLLRITVGILALLFCGWALWSSGLKMAGLALLITLSGVPIYLYKNKT